MTAAGRPCPRLHRISTTLLTPACRRSARSPVQGRPPGYKDPAGDHGHRDPGADRVSAAFRHRVRRGSSRRDDGTTRLHTHGPIDHVGSCAAAGQPTSGRPAACFATAVCTTSMRFGSSPGRRSSRCTPSDRTRVQASSPRTMTSTLGGHDPHLESGTWPSCPTPATTAAGTTCGSSCTDRTTVSRPGVEPEWPIRSTEPGVTFPDGDTTHVLHGQVRRAFRKELDAFTDVVAGTIASPCTVADAVEVGWIAEAATLSLHQHRPVRMSELRDSQASSYDRVGPDSTSCPEPLRATWLAPLSEKNRIPTEPFDKLRARGRQRSTRRCRLGPEGQRRRCRYGGHRYNLCPATSASYSLRACRVLSSSETCGTGTSHHAPEPPNRPLASTLT